MAVPQAVGGVAAVVTAILTRALAGSELRPRRAAAVTTRNVVAFRTSGTYWWLVVSGFAEPILYLLAIGWGVGALVGDIELPDGRVVSYLTFLAPALLATAAMNGAIAESTMNFFAKMKFVKLYDSVLNTPVTPVEIAFGELGWAMIRGGMYTCAFLVVMVAMDLTTPMRAVAALPAALLVGFAFGGIGIALATFMRSWQDFDYVGIVQFALFLFSGTFVPVHSYPAALQGVVYLTPLYHGVELIRSITTGPAGWGQLWNVAYLLVVTTAGLTIAARRMTRLLCK
jgi:lipooligosaccharide transport system permease protein